MGKELKRINYLTGFFLESKDYNQDKEYQRRIQGLHNGYLHTWGILSGLDVKPVTDSNMEIYVTEGAAIDLTKEGLDGSSIKESISRQILIYDGHPNNPIDLSEYNAGDNIYIFASYLECKADWECERGQGEEIHIWECGRLSFAPEKPVDNKNNILLARVVPKKVSMKNGDITYEETVIDGTCIYYTDTDGSELREYAGPYARELALKKFIFKFKEQVENMPFIKAYLEKLDIKATTPTDSGDATKTASNITNVEFQAKPKLEIIKSALLKCIENVTSPDQKKLQDVFQINNLDYLVNIIGSKQLTCMLEKVLADLINTIKNENYIDEFEKINSAFENIIISVSKTDQQKLSDILKQFAVDLEKFTYSENATDRDDVVAKLERIKSNIEECAENIIDTDAEKLTDLLKTIKSDLVNIKNDIVEAAKKNSKLTKSAGKLKAFADNQNELELVIEDIKTGLVDAEKLVDKPRENKIAEITAKLDSCINNVVTTNQNNLITVLKTINTDLESLKNNIGQETFKSGLKKITDSLLNLANSNTEEIEGELRNITVACAELPTSIDTADKDEIASVIDDIDFIAYCIRKCTENVVTVYQKELKAVLRAIKDDLNAGLDKISQTEFVSRIKKIIARLQNLPYNQKVNYKTDLDKIVITLNTGVADQSTKIKSDLSNLISTVNRDEQNILNVAMIDAVKALNKVDVNGQPITVDDLINSVDRLNNANQQGVICLLKKNMVDLVNYINNSSEFDFDGDVKELLEKIRSNLEECSKNAVKIDQKEFKGELKKFRVGVAQLKDNNQREFINSIKAITDSLKNFLKSLSATNNEKVIEIEKVIDPKDIVYLENSISFVDIFAIGNTIIEKLKKIKTDLKRFDGNSEIDKDLLLDILKSLDNCLPYLDDKINKTDAINSLEKGDGYLKKCTETAIIINQKELLKVLRKFKYDLLCLSNEGQAQPLITITDGLLSFINSSTDGQGLVNLLQKNVSDLISLTNAIAEADYKDADNYKLGKIKSDIDTNLGYVSTNAKDVITIDKTQFIAVLEKLKSDFLKLDNKADQKELTNSIKTISAILVNYVIDVAAINQGDFAAAMEKSMPGLISLINNVKTADQHEEIINKLNNTRSVLAECIETVIPVEHKKLIKQLEGFVENIASLIENINKTDKAKKLNILKPITADLIGIVNNANITNQEILKDLLREVTSDLVDLTNNIDTTKLDEELLNTLEISTGVVKFSGEVDIADDLKFYKLVSKNKDGTVTPELKIDGKFLQLNSADEDEVWGGLRDGGMDVFRGGPGVAADARIVWSEADMVWKAGFENNLSRIRYGKEWEKLIGGMFNDELHMHGKLSAKKGTALSVDTEGSLSSEGDLLINDKNIECNNGRISLYGNGKQYPAVDEKGKLFCVVDAKGNPVESADVDIPVFEVNSQGVLGSASEGEKAVLSWNKNRKVGIGSVNLSSNADDLDIAGSSRLLIGTNPIRFTSEWTAFPDLTVNQAEICNDTTYYKALMIVGNQSAGQGRKVAISDRLDVNGLLNVNGYMQMKDKLIPSAGRGNNGIVFPSNPGGGSGDAAWIKYYSNPLGGENCTLEIGTSNDGDDNIVLISSGNVGIGTLAPKDKLEVNGSTRVLSGTNPIRFTNSWSGFTNLSPANAEISNDTSGYNALMIVGNRSGGNQRTVSIWDDLEVNGPLEVKGNGNFQISGAIVPGVGNCEVKGIMFPKDPGGGSGDAAWIRYYSDTLRGGGENMTLEIGVSNDSNEETVTSTDWIVTCPYGVPNGCGYWKTTTSTYIGNGGDRLRFRASGGVYVDGNFYIVSSQQYKENINELPITTAQSAIEQLEPVEFNFRGDYSKRTLGFIAESMPSNLASADKKAISPMEIMTVLVSEVKDQEKSISDLQEKIAKLKRKKK